MRARFKTIVGFVCLLASMACGSETVVHNLEEREANKIIELLADNEVSSQKASFDTGRTVVYTISVPSKSRLEAIKVLNRYEMPRRPDNGYTEVFKDSGLIPTQGEEKAKQLAALEGEIEKQLRLVEGILDVQVQLVQPEESSLRTSQDVRSPTTASVTIKFLPNAGGAKPLSEPQIQAVVAAGVERLTPDNVVVVMTPGGQLGRQEKAEPEQQHGGNASGALGKAQRSYMVIGVVACLILVFIVAIQQLRLRTVRGRFIRLQNEIARARRKPGDAPPGV